MPHRITRLKLFRFRGATQPVTIEFDPQKSIVVIFGENGTGKSTLVDAIDVVSNASFGSVKRKGVDYPQKHIASLNEDVKTLEVELFTKAGHSWKATVSGPSVKVADVTTGGQRPSVRILRRRDLLQLIEATPADRYKAIQSFVDVAGVDKCESQLRSDLNALDSQFGRADSARNTAEISLQAMWERERQPEETQLTAPAWAQHRVAEDLAQLRQQATRLSQQQTLTGQLATTAARWQEAYEAQQGCAERLAEAQRLLDEQNNGEQHRRSELISLLSSAEKYLTPPTQPTACPLCANAVDADGLRQRVRTQLQQMQATAALLGSVSTAKKALDTANAGCEQRGTELLKQLRLVVAALAAHEPAAVVPLSMNWGEMQAKLREVTPTDKTCQRAATIATKLYELSADLAAESTALQARITLHDNIEDQLALLKKSTDEVKDIFAIRERLAQTHKLVVTMRRTFIQRILDDITEEVNRLYQTIHKGEKIGLHRFEMDEAKLASMEQRGHFEDVADIVPQAYFSESHLDTFGFCLWLALAKRMNAKQLVLVLDDVFTSVDAPHFQRISDLLADEAQHFQQLIIATHNRLWHEFYKKNGVGIHLIKLERWTLNRGLRPHEDQIMAAELAAALEAEPFSRQAVASQAGILLESVLDGLALTYGCRLPRKHGHSYTLSELLNGTSKLLKKATVKRLDRNEHGHPTVPESWTELKLDALFQELATLTFIRNEVGAHFNPSGADLADGDVLAFGQAALKLAQALACPTCGHLPQNERDDHRGCRCQKYQTQLRPLKLN